VSVCTPSREAIEQRTSAAERSPQRTRPSPARLRPAGTTASLACGLGSRWTGQQLDEATGGVVTRSYFTNLRIGRIENPGYEKMAAMAKAMGFPPEAWFEKSVGRAPTGLADDGRGIVGRV